MHYDESVLGPDPARRIAEDLLLMAARAREGDDEIVPTYTEDASRRFTELLVSWAERVVADFEIDPGSVWTPDALAGLTELGQFAPKQKVTVKRFVVTVAYDPRDVNSDPELPHLVHHAMLENGPEMVWDEVYADEVVLGRDETCGDVAASVHVAI